MKTADVLIAANAVYGLSAFHLALPMGARAERGTWEKVHKLWSFAPERADAVVDLYCRVFGDSNVTVHEADCHVAAINARSHLDDIARSRYGRTDGPKAVQSESILDDATQPDATTLRQRAVEVEQTGKLDGSKIYHVADFVRALLEAERDLYTKRIEEIDAKLLAMSKPVDITEVETIDVRPVVEPKPKPKPRRKPAPVSDCPF